MGQFATKHQERLYGTPIGVLNKDITVNMRKGIIEGYLTRYNIPGTQTPVVDPYRDIVEPGAFTKTIKDLEHSRELKGYTYLAPHLWQHNPGEIIGGTKWLLEDSHGVVFETQLAKGVKRADEALELIDQNMLPGISYGYDAIRAPVMAGLRHLKEVRLHETSSVTFPANEYAGVTGIKSLFVMGAYPIGLDCKDMSGPMDLNTRLAQQEPQEAMQDFYSLLDTFGQAVVENMNAGLSDNLSLLISQFTMQLTQWAQESGDCIDLSGSMSAHINYLQKQLETLTKDTQYDTSTKNTRKGWEFLAPYSGSESFAPSYSIRDISK